MIGRRVVVMLPPLFRSSSKRVFASSAHLQWRTKQASRLIDAPLKEPFSGVSAAMMWSRPVSFRGNEDRGALVLHEEHQELRRLYLTRVPRDDVHVVWSFVERLARQESDRVLALNLHHD